MPLDCRFEILKVLNTSNAIEVDFRPIFMPLIEKGEATRTGLNTTLYNLKRDGFILFGRIGNLNTSQGGVYVEDSLPIMLRLQDKGIDEYLRLKKQYNPETPYNNIQIGGDFVGNLNQGNLGPVTQSTNEESPETVALAKKSVKIGKWTLIWTAVGVIVAILIAVFAAHGSK